MTWLHSTNQYLSVAECKHWGTYSPKWRKGPLNSAGQTCFLGASQTRRGINMEEKGKRNVTIPSTLGSLPGTCGWNRGSRRTGPSSSPPLPRHSPLQLLQGHCDPQAMAQDVESGQDVCPLHHLSQWPAL